MAGKAYGFKGLPPGRDDTARVTLHTVPGPQLPSGMCAPVSSVQMCVHTVAGSTPTSLASLTRIPLPQATPGRNPVSKQPLWLPAPAASRAASSRDEVTPDQVGGGTCPKGMDEPREETSCCWPACSDGQPQGQPLSPPCVLLPPRSLSWGLHGGQEASVICYH